MSSCWRCAHASVYRSKLQWLQLDDHGLLAELPECVGTALGMLSGVRRGKGSQEALQQCLMGEVWPKMLQAI